jgi:hypothetical protein
MLGELVCSCCAIMSQASEGSPPVRALAFPRSTPVGFQGPHPSRSLRLLAAVEPARTTVNACPAPDSYTPNMRPSAVSSAIRSPFFGGFLSTDAHLQGAELGASQHRAPRTSPEPEPQPIECLAHARPRLAGPRGRRRDAARSRIPIATKGAHDASDHRARRQGAPVVRFDRDHEPYVQRKREDVVEPGCVAARGVSAPSRAGGRPRLTTSRIWVSRLNPRITRFAACIHLVANAIRGRDVRGGPFRDADATYGLHCRGQAASQCGSRCLAACRAGLHRRGLYARR